MSTTLETALQALAAALSALPGGAKLERNADVPTTVDLPGLLILRDGDPGEPEITLSPLRYSFDHVAALEIYVQAGATTARAATLPDLLAEVGAALAGASRTLGGRVEFVSWSAPSFDDTPVAGAATIRGAHVAVTLSYTTSNPLT